MKQIGKKKPTVKKPPVRNAASGQFGQSFGQIFDRVKKKKKK